MKAHSPPSKIARVADTGMGSMEGEPPLIGHGLRLGPGLNHGKSGFTFQQLQELEHQALIFKYMVAGVPVPLHLVLPIWKSVVSSFGGVNGGIYQHHPSFLRCSTLCFDYRNSMEAEPGRCRRTDGKKWRCSKEVVPDQKYCERHMHRGRNRSRKHVEASKITASAAITNNSKGNENSNSNTNLSISVPASLQLMTNTSSSSNNNNNSSNVSSSLGFSPKSVLMSGICKTESPE